ncbi:MAG: ATP-binding cassette domain-containing protein [Desulfuromonadales bacterium]|nr:ATP-binding cassette domain-containing protein [Desulfuromonadales bacterium]
MNDTIEAKGLFKQFDIKRSPLAPKQKATVVDNVDIALTPGETLGLAGESGSGKSTVAKLLAGLLPPTSGEIFFNGKNISAFSTAEHKQFRKSVQMIFQDPFSSLNPKMKVGDIIGEPLLIHKTVPKKLIKENVLKLMNRVGLSPDDFNRYPHQFSGGQRQRIGIARALSLSPSIIIADEPVSALDISIQAQIINLLNDLQKESGLSYLFISHDLHVIRHISDRIAIMYLGRIVEIGKSEDIFLRTLHPYTEALNKAVPNINSSKSDETFLLNSDIPSPIAPPEGCHFHPRCPYAKDICKSKKPELIEKEKGHKAACHFSNEIFKH